MVNVIPLEAFSVCLNLIADLCPVYAFLNWVGVIPSYRLNSLQK